MTLYTGSLDKRGLYIINKIDLLFSITVLYDHKNI